MADIRINALATTAASTASDDFVAVDGSANGTRKLNAFSPTFGGNLTVSGGTITGGTSGMSLDSGGTNQNITLTPSGTGKVTLSNGTSAQPMLDITNTNTVPTKNGLRILGPNATSSSARQFALIANSTAYGDLELRRSTTNTGDPTSGDYIFGVSANGNFLLSTTTDNSATFAANRTGTGPASSGSISTAAIRAVDVANDLALDIGVNSAASPYPGWIQVHGRTNQATNYPLALNPNGGVVLVNTTANSGNGAIQLATHTTSAGGIGFGTVTSLYASSVSGCLELSAASGTTGGFKLYNTTNQRGQFVYSGTDVYIDASTLTGQLIFRTNGSTTALTLDSSQNATFAGRVRAGTAVGTAKTVLIDAAFTTVLNVTKTFTVTMPSPSLASSFVLEVGVYGNTATGYASLMVKGGGYLGTSTLYEATELTKINSGSVTISSVTKANGSMTFTVINTSSSGHVAICYKQTSDDVFTTLPTITAV